MKASDKTLIRDVSDTAIWVATYRARESERADALFHDPLARLLAGDEGEKIARQMHGSDGTGWSVVVRTCIIDEYIMEAIAHGVDTVVNLGTGLDTRPYRMPLPASLNWIEVDYPNIIALKEERLKGQTPRCQLRRVSLDLAEPEKRRAFLASVNAQAKKALVLTEGVLPYLTEAHVAALATDLRAQAHITYWIGDFYEPEFMAFMRRRRKMMKQMQNAPFLFEPADWRAFFRDLGWQPEKLGYLVLEGIKRRRRPPSPWIAKLIWMVLWPFMSSARKKAMAEMCGYALFKAVPPAQG